MRKLQLITLSLCLLFVGVSYAQKHSETITDQKRFPSNSSENLLVVYNVNGPVRVEGTNGNEVSVTVKKTIEGNNTRQLEQGKSEIGIKVETRGNIIYVYHDSPYTEFNLETGRFNHKGSWNGSKYHYKLDITVKVPKNTNLELSTINNGDIFASRVEANDITVSNINGAITLEDIAGKTYANALNKDINISYSKNPSKDSKYASLNGDININVQSGLNADISFKSLNGDIYTNLETRSSSGAMEMSKRKGKKGTKYKMNKDTQFQIGSGGVQLDFDVLNGDVTIKG
ncbi:hypothetical protein POV27_09810 [Aureisphaera galaxeae]|uniref:DUF4097 family beta strand repeat-containing protein n=1 Tax=Aureisphaera galaxeae TaxID=1538023 RepID=UPI0023500ED6|nr:hypothetical protein [Aureisphaera galaxeae]MDC8004347.1 hypothetical protein [Aureisphaera galaxeae]